MADGVVASILDCDFAGLAKEVRAVDRHVDRFQPDVMEAHLVQPELPLLSCVMRGSFIFHGKSYERAIAALHESLP